MAVSLLELVEQRAAPLRSRLGYAVSGFHQRHDVIAQLAAAEGKALR